MDGSARICRISFVKKKKKSNVTVTNYFIIFLQTIDITQSN